jgi:hypothetical protein
MLSVVGEKGKTGVGSTGYRCDAPPSTPAQRGRPESARHVHIDVLPRETRLTAWVIAKGEGESTVQLQSERPGTAQDVARRQEF